MCDLTPCSVHVSHQECICLFMCCCIHNITFSNFFFLEKTPWAVQCSTTCVFRVIQCQHVCIIMYVRVCVSMCMLCSHTIHERPCVNKNNRREKSKEKNCCSFHEWYACCDCNTDHFCLSVYVYDRKKYKKIFFFFKKTKIQPLLCWECCACSES